MEITGIGGLVILIADIYAIVMILQSSEQSIKKLMWALVVVLLPLIGLIIWYVAGPGKKPFRIYSGGCSDGVYRKQPRGID